MHLTTKLTVRVAAVAAVAALALTGCTPAQTSTGPSGAAAFNPSSVAKDDALIALLPAAIKDKPNLMVGSDTTYAPAESLGGSNGQTPVGYDVDFAKAIAATLGKTVTVQTAEFSSILPSLGSKYDLGISSFTITPERLNAVNFVSYFNAGVQWAVQKGNPKNFTVAGACGKSVGVQTGTIEENPVVSDLSAACVKAGKPAIKIISLPHQTDITTRLVSGNIDAMSADSPITGYAIAQTNGALETLGGISDAAPEGIAIAKNDPQLASVMAKVVNKLIADGTYKKILDSWNNTQGAIPTAQVNPAVSN